MSYFITARAAMKEYGIREAQLVEIADSGEVALYDSAGRLLSREEVQSLLDCAYREALTFFKQQYMKAGGSPFALLGNRLDQYFSPKAAEAAPLKMIQRCSFVRTEFESALGQIFPEIFAYYQQNQNPVSPEHLPATAPESEIPPESNRSLITVPEELQHAIPETTAAAWSAAIQQYEERYVKRKNDALPKRMRAYLRRATGESFSEIETEHQNLSRTLKLARKTDIPRLKSLFPELPDLPVI